MNEVLYWLIAAIVVMIWTAVTFIIAAHSYYNGMQDGIRTTREAADKEATRNGRMLYKSMQEAAKRWCTGLPITGDLRQGGVEMFHEIYKTLPESWTKASEKERQTNEQNQN